MEEIKYIISRNDQFVSITKGIVCLLRLCVCVCVCADLTHTAQCQITSVCRSLRADGQQKLLGCEKAAEEKERDTFR